MFWHKSSWAEYETKEWPNCQRCVYNPSVSFLSWWCHSPTNNNGVSKCCCLFVCRLLLPRVFVYFVLFSVVGVVLWFCRCCMSAVMQTYNAFHILRSRTVTWNEQSMSDCVISVLRYHLSIFNESDWCSAYQCLDLSVSCTYSLPW